MDIQTSFNVMWTAVDQDTYDGAEDSNCPIGHGSTEREAVNQLVEQLVEREEAASRKEIERLTALLQGARCPNLGWHATPPTDPAPRCAWCDTRAAALATNPASVSAPEVRGKNGTALRAVFNAFAYAPGRGPEWYELVRAALANDPNPSGQSRAEASAPAQVSRALDAEASGPVGLGPAARDAARLDWMAKHLHRIGEIYLPDGKADCHAWAISSARNDLREALDAAMAASEPEQPAAPRFACTLRKYAWCTSPIECGMAEKCQHPPAHITGGAK